MSRGKVIPFPKVAEDRRELSDEALVAACAVGDAVALEAIFDRYCEAVYCFLDRLASTDERDMEDLVQSVFLEVARAARSFGGRSRVKTWILGIAVNVARNHARSESRRRVFLSALRALPEELSLPPAAAPDEVAERREELARVAAALEELPRELKEAFLLCEVEGLSGEEAALAAGVKTGTLWRRLHEARRALRAALEGDES